MFVYSLIIEAPSRSSDGGRRLIYMIAIDLVPTRTSITFSVYDSPEKIKSEVVLTGGGRQEDKIRRRGPYMYIYILCVRACVRDLIYRS